MILVLSYLVGLMLILVSYSRVGVALIVVQGGESPGGMFHVSNLITPVAKR